jgi:hypothetical protein
MSCRQELFAGHVFSWQDVRLMADGLRAPAIISQHTAESLQLEFFGLQIDVLRLRFAAGPLGGLSFQESQAFFFVKQY